MRLALIAALLLLQACGSVTSRRYETTEHPQGGVLIVRISFSESEEHVARRCAELGIPDSGGGCGTYFPPIVGTQEKVIIVRRPKDFNDWEGICLLGHEVVHTLGGKHK